MSAARHYDREGGLARFSLDRRVTVLVLFLTALVVGAVATQKIPVELIPTGYDEPWLSVFVPWENAPSKEVLDKIALPLEEELATVRGLNAIYSSSRVGRGFVWVNFKNGTDMDVAYREVRDRVERAKARFPDDVDRVYIRKDDASGIPVFVLGVALDPGIHDTYNLVQKRIVDVLTRIDGVASVEVEGLLEKEILIELDREKTSAAGLNIWELAQDLGSDNFTMASGTVRDGSDKLLLRSMAKFETVEQLENRLISDSIRVRDIATVSYEEPDKNFRVRAMSKPAVAVVVMKEGDANIKDVSNAVAAQVDRFKQDPRLAEVETVTLFSQGEVIDEALTTLLQSGAIGGVLAAFVLYFFLRRYRLTMILALSIPLSMMLGLTVMYFGGETLNLLTLLGLMICVGLLVDNAVVVAENIHRLHRSGMDRRQAAIHGAGEVGLAITMSTLTTIVVFLPAALVEGPAQFFLFRLAMPVCVSVAGSLLVALVFVPLCVYMTLSDDPNAKKESFVARTRDRLHELLRRAYEASFGRVNRAYTGLLVFFMRRRLDMVLAMFGVAMLTAAIPGSSVSFVEAQEEERSGFFIGVEMPRSYTLEETEAWFLEAEKIVENKKEELGLAGWFQFHRKTHGEIQGWFTRPKTSDVTPAEATRIVRDALPKPPGIKLHIADEREGRDASGQDAFAVTLIGEDYRQLESVRDQLEEALSRVPGVLGAQGGNEPPPNELALVVDRERTQRYGVNPQAVAGVVGTALRGMELPKYHADGKEIPVRVRFEEADRESLAELSDFLVPTMSGDLLPVSTLTRAEFLDTPETIFRKNKRLSRTVNLQLEEGKEDETRERLAFIVGNIDLPEGVTLAQNAARQDFDEDLAAIGKFALPLSIVLIYLLMGFLFESFSLPLSIILTIPASAIGVWWAHLFAGRNIDFLGVVAMVLLIGVVVNNGIVLIDYVNRLRNQGHSRHDALIQATSRRFRPIMMTAITTIGGLLPLAFAGANSIGLSYTSFAITLIGGMTTATLLTLLVVPVFYTMIDDLRGAFATAMGRAVRPRPVPATVEPPSAA